MPGIVSQLTDTISAIEQVGRGRQPVRIAVVSDIHGNLPALEAVLDDLRHQAPDDVWCGGDIGWGG
ncbi:MAG: metallophosphoesterase family protein, partial [Actinomycetota bacterium]